MILELGVSGCSALDVVGWIRAAGAVQKRARPPQTTQARAACADVIQVLRVFKLPNEPRQ